MALTWKEYLVSGHRKECVRNDTCIGNMFDPYLHDVFKIIIIIHSSPELIQTESIKQTLAIWTVPEECWRERRETENFRGEVRRKSYSSPVITA